MMTRRNFLKGTAAAVVGASAVGMLGGLTVEAAEDDMMTVEDYTKKKWSFEIAPEPIADDEISETKEADIIVVGAGTSGICTAISAKQAGASVILFAKGQGAVGRGGSVFAVYSRYSEELGIPKLSPEDLRQEIKNAGFNVDIDKWYKWYKNSEEAMNWFIDLTEQTDLVFRMERGNNGEGAGDLSYCPLGTHTWQDASATNCADGQPATMAALLELAIGMGVEVYFNTTALQLVREDNNTGRVTAVIAADADGNYICYKGAKAIVLATGDFSADREMMERYAPQSVDRFTNYDADLDPENGKVYGGLYKGDGQKMGLWIGAAWQKGFPNATMVGAFGSQGGTLAYNVPTGFLCNTDGHRFCCELMTTGLMSRVMPHLKGGKFFHIWDTDYAVNAGEWYLGKTWYQQEVPTPEDMIATWDDAADVEMMFKADTLEELAEMMDLPVEETLAEIERYNGMCEAGEDTDFFKPAKYLAPIKTGPFYGSVCSSCVGLTVMGGLRTNINMQVCDENDEAIPGLYNVGTMTGDVFSNAYTFQVAGHNLGMTCVTFGYLTGKYIAENE